MTPTLIIAWLLWFGILPQPPAVRHWLGSDGRIYCSLFSNRRLLSYSRAEWLAEWPEDTYLWERNQ